MSEWQYQPHQIEGADRIVNAVLPGRLYLADQMRVMKTGTALLARERLKPRTTLLIAGVNAQMSWLEKCPKFDVEPPVIIEGHAEDRRKMWRKGYPFVCVTKETLLRDVNSGVVPAGFDMILGDEMHKMSNRPQKAKTVAAARQIVSDYFIPITGSPMKRGPQNLWPMLNWIAPKVFTSYWKWVDKYCVTAPGFGGHMQIIGPKNLNLMVPEIRPYFIRRLRSQIGLPEKTREVETIRLTPAQEKLYHRFQQEALLDLESNIVVAPNTMVKIIYLRQLLVCPQLLDPSLEDGANLNWMVDKLEDSDDNHCVIMTPFPDSRLWIKKRLQSEGYKDVFIIGSGMKIPELQAQIKGFRQTRGIMLCSLKFAEAFDLAPAKWGMMAGYEWDLESNHQAEDRLFGGEMKDPILWYYCKHQDTVDEKLMMPILDAKARGTGAVDRAWIKEALK
jgi:hypothetical protein